MEWKIYEHHDIEKHIRNKRIPKEIVKKYTIWKTIVTMNGPYALRKFPGLNDEALRGDRKGQRSSRLNIQYRVVYKIIDNEIVVKVIEITPHKY